MCCINGSVLYTENGIPLQEFELSKQYLNRMLNMVELPVLWVFRKNMLRTRSHAGWTGTDSCRCTKVAPLRTLEWPCTVFTSRTRTRPWSCLYPWLWHVNFVLARMELVYRSSLISLDWNFLTLEDIILGSPEWTALRSNFYWVNIAHNEIDEN